MRKGLIKASLVAACGLSVAAGAHAQQEAQTPVSQTVEVKGMKDASRWFRAESQHFVVYSDTRHEDVFQLLNNLEKLDYLLRIFTKDYNTGRGSQQKIALYYHDRMGSFQQITGSASDEVVGLYNSCGAGVQGFGVHLERIGNLTNEELGKTPLNNSLSYLFEAYTRHFLYRNTDIRSPSSFIDGFAQYFSSVRFSDSQLTLGRVPTNLGKYFRFIDNGRSQSLGYKEVFEPDDGSGDGYLNESLKRLEFLSKSWLLTHYMLSTDVNLGRKDKYLELVYQDVPASKAFETAFGLTPAQIDEMMWRYRIKGNRVVQVDLPTLPTAKVSYETLPASVTDYILADGTLKSCPDRKTGEALLRTLSQRAGGVPNNDMARLTVSRAQIDWGNPADALPALTDITRKAANNAEAHYLLGLANLRLAERGNDAGSAGYAQAAKRSLARARSLNPRSAQAAYATYLAEIRGNDKPDEAVLKNAIAAWSNAHEVNTYARAAALSYALLGRATEADNALAVIAHNTRDAAMAAWAKSWQGRLRSGVGRAEVLAEMRREPDKATAFKEWTVATADLIRNAEYNAGMEDARGYLNSQRMSDPTGANGVSPSTLSIWPKQ
ncbi:MAG: hypothetical protein ABIT83_09775 [Massilia sp.]